MQLFITQPYLTDSPTLVVEVDSLTQTKVSDLKTIIAAKDPSIPPDIGLRTLISSQLDNQRFLSEYNIQDMQTLQIVPQFHSRCEQCSDPETQ